MLDAPRSLSPSKLAKFTSCPLAFRYVYVDGLPEPPSTHKVKGTLVHAALEGLFWHHPAGSRTPEAALEELEAAVAAVGTDPEWTALDLAPDDAVALVEEARQLVRNYFELEDPDRVHAVAMELGLETDLDGRRLRGIIDRLDRNEDGDLVVVDYKTGRAPAERYERGNLAGVHLYALLCRQVLGRAPVEVRLLHLREPLSITAVPTPQALRGQERRAVAVWQAVERSCATGDFRPRPSALCPSCGFRDRCPAAGSRVPVALVS